MPPPRRLESPPLILAIECSGKSASVALARGGQLLAELESTPTDDSSSARTLAPAIDSILRQANVQPQELDSIAVTSGPGSFTGLRVGVALAKTMAYSVGISTVPVDTLKALALTALLEGNKHCAPSGKQIQPNPGLETASPEVSASTTPRTGTLWTVLDAYRGELFSAAWELGTIWTKFDKMASSETSANEKLASIIWDGNHLQPTRIGIQAELVQTITNAPQPAFIVGPGCRKINPMTTSLPSSSELHPETFPTAAAVAQLAWRAIQLGQEIDPMRLMPTYLRGSAAEEKRKATTHES